MIKEIRIDGIVGDWGNTSEEFNFKLDELDLQADDELLVKINSVGGSVIEGWGIYNRLKSLDNKVTARGEGIVASIASLILMAGDVREMSEVGALMIHRASNHVQGNAEELEKAAEVLKTIDDTLLSVYNGMTNDDVTEEMMTEWLENETWFSPSEAKDHGFINEVVNKVETTVSAIYKPNKLSEMATLKEQLKAILNISETEEAVTEVVEEVVEEAAAETTEEVVDEVKPELMTAEQATEIIAALSQINERLNKIENPEQSVDDVVEAKIRILAKGIKSKGGAPVANGDLNGGVNLGYVPKNAGFKALMENIKSKTQIQ